MKKYFFILIFFLSVPNLLQAQSGLELTLEEKQSALDYARLVLDDNGADAEEIPFSDKLQFAKNPVIVTFFDDKGSLVSTERENDSTLTLKQKLERLVRPENHSNENFVHVMIVSDVGNFNNFGITGLFDNRIYEPHVTGIIYEWQGKRAELTPLETLYLNLGPKSVRTYLAKKIGMDVKKMPEMDDLKIEIYRVIHFGESYPDHEFTEFHRGHKVFKAEEVTPEEILNRLKLIGGWYAHNTFEGQVAYEYFPSVDREDGSRRTMIRSTMAVWILNRLAFFLKDKNLQDLGKKSIQFYLERYFQMSESLKKDELIPSPVPEKKDKDQIAQNKFPAASFLVGAILERGEEKKYVKEIKLLMDWVMKFQKEDGVIWSQYAQGQYFEPGQILLMIADLYEKTKDQKYKDFFDKSFQKYASAIQDMMRLGTSQYAPYAPAWFTQPFAKMYTITRDTQYRGAVFLINDNVVKWYDVNKEYQVYFDYDGMLAPKPWHYGNVSITAASLESLCDAAHVAKLSGDSERFKKYSFVIRHTVAYLTRLQFTPENTYYVKNRERALGGFKTDLVNSRIWMDNVWHLTSAFIKIHRHELLGE